MQEKQLLRFCFQLLTFVSVILFSFFSSKDFNWWQQFFNSLNSEARWLRAWNPVGAGYGFSQTQYFGILGSLAFISVISAIISFRLPKDHELGMIAFLKRCFGQFVISWRKFSGTEKKLILFTWSGLIGLRLYLLNFCTVGFDEAFTFVLFLKKEIYGVWAYYPVPNNHVFYSALCLPGATFFSDPFWVLKLPTLLISIFTTVSLYFLLRSVLKFGIAFPVLVGLSLTNGALYYSLHGRGYYLLLLCTACAAVTLYKALEKSSNFYWVIFILSSLIGFLTIPVFLYPFAAIILFGVISLFRNRNRVILAQFIIAVGFVGLITILLYGPVLTISGFERLFKNVFAEQMDKEQPVEQLVFYLRYMQGAILGQPSYGFYPWLIGVVFLICLLVFRSWGTRLLFGSGVSPRMLVWVLCGSIVPWVVMFIQGVLPPERIWLFKSFFDFTVLAIAGYFVWCNWNITGQKFLSVFFISGAILFAGYQVKILKQHQLSQNSPDNQFTPTIEAIFNHNVKTIFSTAAFYSEYLQYYYRWRGVDKLAINSKSEGLYDCVILTEPAIFPEQLNADHYVLFKQDKFVKIYFNKTKLKVIK